MELAPSLSLLAAENHKDSRSRPSSMQSESGLPNEREAASKNLSKPLNNVESTNPLTDYNFPNRSRIGHLQKSRKGFSISSTEKISPTKFSGRQISFGPALDGTENQFLRSDYINPEIQYESLVSSHNRAGDEYSGFIVPRVEHVITEEGHSVISRGVVRRCEDEPIQTPGAIQSFGLLIALNKTQSGRFVIRIVSENSSEIIGYTPQELFQLYCFTNILTQEYSQILTDRVNFIRNGSIDPSIVGPEVFALSVKLPQNKMGDHQMLWCAMHIHPSQSDLIVCEFELDDDSKNPLFPESNNSSELKNTLKEYSTESADKKDQIALSKPLRVNNMARKRKGEVSAIDIFNTISQVLEQLEATPDLKIFSNVLAGIVKELTGYHRVMIYQFDASFNGRVISEIVDSPVTRDLYSGLNFPASDIPQQARDLYKVNKVILLYDRESLSARLVCRSKVDFEKPLDLSYSYLRAISPIHIKYLGNMAVRSSLSIPINSLNRLWGIVACHGYGTKGIRISFPMRQIFRIVGNAASRNIERLFCIARLDSRKVFDACSISKDKSEFIVASTEDVLRVFDADCGFLSIQGQIKVMGSPEDLQEVFSVQKYFSDKKVASIISSQDIGSDFPDLNCPTGFKSIAGILMVPLTVTGKDFIFFFRKAQALEVKWAGNPYEKYTQEPEEGYLAPRKSFKVWRETVVGKCREWTDEQVEAAAILCYTYGRFIEVWRQKEEILPKKRLTELLLANTAHELRTPLNAIINYLEIAMEAPLDQETRDNLGQSCYASKSLIYVVNDLLDLTKTEQGQELIRDEIFDLTATFEEVIDSFKEYANRKGLNYQVKIEPTVPRLVIGDQGRLRKAITNLIANAMKFTMQGIVRVWVSLQSTTRNSARIDTIIEDSGCGMSNQEIEVIFKDLDNVTVDSALPEEQIELPTNSHPPRLENKKLGLGLALVSRIVQNMNGKLRVNSEKEKGTRFTIELNFDLPDLNSSHTLERGQISRSQSSSISNLSEISKTLSPKELEPLLAEDSNPTSNPEAGSNLSRERDFLSNFEENSLEMTSIPRNSIILGNGVPSEFMSRNSKQKQKRGSDEPNPNVIYNTKKRLSSINFELPESDVTTCNSISCLNDTTSYTATTISFHKSGVAVPKKEITLIEEDVGNLQILLAEDDIVNSRIIHKRLGKFGHEVHHTVNGGECAHVYAEKKAYFDVILMDLQMPIVDGIASTKMIRSFESTQSQFYLSKLAKFNGRVPIFAVSASLVETKLQSYIDTGFDGWIMKPIDFKRLNTILQGIFESSIRDSCIYSPGKWERGGWFHSRFSDK